MTVRKIAAAGALLVALAAGCRGAWAVWPQVWFKGSQAHFEPGRFDRVSLSDAGEVALAPAPELVFEPAGESFVWSLAESRAGELYAGTGPHGRVYRRSKGKWGLALETGDVAVTALAAAPDGSVYAGTIPSGRIFRIASGGFQAGPPIETGERYVWALRSLPDGALVAGTGARARVLRFDEPGAVPPEKPKVLLESQEDHILCLLRWPDGALLAGSGGHGLLYRIEPDGKTRVVFDAPQEEIRALAIDGD
ncbi:MAG: hypothetical protein HY303_03585, partial [Candidatus Wallbacteria bacterium]|nr:hypothetical protein [Candidatus Wallbacteria bacterium]